MQDKPSFAPAYAAMQAYVAPLNPQLWRLVVGMVVMLLVYLAGMVAYGFVLVVWFDVNLDGLIAGDSPLHLVLLLSSHVFMGLGAVVAAWWPGRHPILGLIGPLGAAQRDFWRVLVVMVPIIALMCLLMWAFDDSFTPNLALSQLLPWLPLAIVVLFIQVGAEELVFRGYIMGQLAARFARPLVWMILPSILFGMAHYDTDTYGNQAWIVCVATAVWAIVISDITARTGNLGAAIGLHFGNNFMPFILIGYVGNLDGLALGTVVLDLTNLVTIAAQFVYIALIWFAVRRALKV